MYYSLKICNLSCSRFINLRPSSTVSFQTMIEFVYFIWLVVKGDWDHIIRYSEWHENGWGHEWTFIHVFNPCLRR